MTNYIVDENVVRNAWHGKKIDGGDAVSEQKFIHDLFYGNDHLSASEKIRKKFILFRKKTERIKDGVNDLLLPMYLKLLFDSSRTTMHDAIKTNFKGIKECDNEFVGVTIKAMGVLVTADSRLKGEIAKDETVRNCECKTVEEVLENTK